MLPDIWHYHPDTKVLIGRGLADPSPLDPPGTWLVPACATDIEPPATIKDGEQAVFVDDAWEVEPIPPPPDMENPVVTPL